MEAVTPPSYTIEAVREVAVELAQRAEALQALADEAEAMTAEAWGLAVANVALDVYAYGLTVTDSGAAIAVLGGASVRSVAEHLGIAPNTLPRRLAGVPEFSDYATTGQPPRITNAAIERARYDLAQGNFTVEGEHQAVQRRRR